MTRHRRTINQKAGAPDPPPVSLTEQVYDALKEEILRAVRRPGEAIAEPELSLHFGVSKTPVREALRLLIRDGWVLVLPRKGYLIRPLGLEDVREVFALRQMLEPPLVADAARRAGAAGIAELRDAVAAQAGAGEDVDLALDAATRFHLSIAEIAGNGRAVRILAGLVDEMRRLHYLMPQLESHIRSPVELEAHAAIVEAIAEGDAERGAALMREHLTEAGHEMVAVFGGLETTRQR
jgi:DNA-binding GntR family transcriptional regulator